ncbi:MAG: hypothetical protein HY051_00150 [Candidatus Aenigmarchaeota archaeon]|nr:hypothetical protein [Candidatus Aenigmarchaeota archaeon]
MVKSNDHKTLTNTFVTVVGVLLVVGGYLLIGVMSVLPVSDNVTKALVMLAVLIIISSITQLATFSIISNEKRDKK